MTTPQDLSGKTAIVTGASRGIGRAIALGLAERGAAVAVGYLRNDQLASEVVGRIRKSGGAAIAVQADLARAQEVTALFDRAERELGPREITVNAISPGFTDTDLLPDRDREVAAGMSPFARVGQPDDVAAAAVFLATDQARWITGQNLAAGGGVF